GQVLPLVLLLMAVAALGLVLVARSSSAAADRARAQGAADAAALAGAVEGRAGALRIAQANGGELVRFESDGEAVTVVVAFGEAQATARAALEWRRCVPPDPCGQAAVP